MKRLLISILCCLLAIAGNTQALSRPLRDSFITNSILHYYKQSWVSNKGIINLYTRNGFDFEPGNTPKLPVRMFNNRQEVLQYVNNYDTGKVVYSYELVAEMTGTDTFEVNIFYDRLWRDAQTGCYSFTRRLCQRMALMGYAVYNRRLQRWVYKSPDQLYYEWDLERAGIKTEAEIF